MATASGLRRTCASTSRCAQGLADSQTCAARRSGAVRWSPLDDDAPAVARSLPTSLESKGITSYACTKPFRQNGISGRCFRLQLRRLTDYRPLIHRKVAATTCVPVLDY